MATWQRRGCINNIGQLNEVRHKNKPKPKQTIEEEIISPMFDLTNKVAFDRFVSMILDDYDIKLLQYQKDIMFNMFVDKERS